MEALVLEANPALTSNRAASSNFWIKQITNLTILASYLTVIINRAKNNVRYSRRTGVMYDTLPGVAIDQ